MSVSTGPVVLSSEMRYADALALLRAAWPALRVLLYTPTVEHYKQGHPTEEELEKGPDEVLSDVPGRQAVLRGGMTGQDLHHAVMTAFGLETEVRGVGLRSLWTVTLDVAGQAPSWDMA